MKCITKKITVLCAITLLAACSGTRHFVDKPVLNMIGANNENISQAIDKLFLKISPNYRISFCEANPETGQCPDLNANLTAKGLGGIFLPLVLELHGIDVEKIKHNDGRIEMKALLDAPVNKIPSKCGTVNGFVEMTSAQSAILKFPSTYCNWMVIGNVLQSASFSIDRINLTDNSFAGYYKIAFFGTGNASGSGYFRGVIQAHE